MQMISFANRVIDFNRMYRLPISPTPVLTWDRAAENPKAVLPDADVNDLWNTQVKNFLSILTTEVEGGDDLS